MSGRHGGGYVRGQGNQSAVESVPDMTELQAIPAQHEMAAGGSYEISEMPAHQQPVELEEQHQVHYRSNEEYTTREEVYQYQQQYQQSQQDAIYQVASPYSSTSDSKLKSHLASSPSSSTKGQREGIEELISPDSSNSVSKVNSRWESIHPVSTEAGREGIEEVISPYSSNSISKVNQSLSAKAGQDIAITIDHQPPNYSHFLSSNTSTRTRKPQKGGWNMFNSGSSFRWKKHPHIFQSPNPKSASTERYRHRDSMARVYKRTTAERFPDTDNGRLTKLMVQTADEIYRANSQPHTWRRTYIRKVGGWMLRSAYWPYKRAPIEAEDRTGDDKMGIALRWLPACLALFFVLPFPSPSPQSLPGFQYHPFPYKYWGTCKVARNPKEDTKTSRALHWNASVDDMQGERLLRPRYLMFLNEPGKDGPPGHTCMKDEDWNKQQPSETTKNLPYVFVAYTKDHFSDDTSDLDALLDIAEAATRRAGLSAFWIGCSCMPEPKNMEEDVYRINDVIRGAYSLVIALGNRNGAEKFRDIGALLLEWGSRMWTFPEALLSPNDKHIEIYTRGHDLSQPIVVSKKDVPTWAWSDADVARQLMDHFQGSLTLSRLEIVNLAMRCLHARKTDAYLEGDMAYALMGLLRRRPMVDRTDSEFQALARLSLANDSDCLLERLICVLPKSMNKDWIRADDAWDVNLWDIYPTCQVAGVGEKDTVILDGCRAASIKWDKFEPVAISRRWSYRRLFAHMMVRLSPILILIGIFTISSGIGVFFLLLGLVLWLGSPYFVKVLCGGKFWDQQAWLFGFEGYVDIGTIEACIFGYNMNRLSWSVSGSPLSRHSVNGYNEWIGRDPTDDPNIAAGVERAKEAKVGGMRVFTIVDTFTMTVTLIEAVRPPVMALLCASEGGNQRAVMCSYDWKTQTLYKETVMRMETQVLERMSRIGRVNFGFFKTADGVERFDV